MNQKELVKWVEKSDIWNLKKGKLVMKKEFEDFRTAWSFFNSIGIEAEAQNHHPTVEIDFNKVKIILYTKEENAITEKDLRMAAFITHSPYLRESKKRLLTLFENNKSIKNIQISGEFAPCDTERPDRQIDCSYSEFQNVDFINSIIKNYNFSFSNFTGCTFKNAVFKNCDFAFATFKNSETSGFIVGKDCKEVNFSL